MNGRVSSYFNRIQGELENAFNENYSPHEIAGSFSIGIFITALPTLGTGLILFVILAYVFDRINSIALFSSVIVLNPIAKWGVYVASFWIGSRILGPVQYHTFTEISYNAGSPIVIRLIIGNVIIAILFAGIGYVIVFRLIREYRKREISVTEILPESITEQTNFKKE